VWLENEEGRLLIKDSCENRRLVTSNNNSCNVWSYGGYSKYIVIRNLVPLISKKLQEKAPLSLENPENCC
jgi:hypothetical protein